MTEGDVEEAVEDVAEGGGEGLADFEDEELPDLGEEGSEDKGELTEEPVEENTDNPSWRSDPVIRKKIIAGGVAVIAFLVVVVVIFIVSPKEEVKKNISRRVKVEGMPESSNVRGPILEPVYYAMPPFLIPLDGGKSFFRIEVILPRLTKGWEKKIEDNPAVYRESVIKVVERKTAAQLKAPGAKMALKREVEATLDLIMGAGVSGGVVFGTYEVN